MSHVSLFSIFCLKTPTVGPIIEFPGSPSSPGGPLGPGSPYPERNKSKTMLITFSFNFQSFAEKNNYSILSDRDNYWAGKYEISISRGRFYYLDSDLSYTSASPQLSQRVCPALMNNLMPLAFSWRLNIVIQVQWPDSPVASACLCPQKQGCITLFLPEHIENSKKIQRQVLTQSMLRKATDAMLLHFKTAHSTVWKLGKILEVFLKYYPVQLHGNLSSVSVFPGKQSGLEFKFLLLSLHRAKFGSF